MVNYGQLELQTRLWYCVTVSSNLHKYQQADSHKMWEFRKKFATWILQQDLKLFPFKIQPLQYQTERNKEEQFTFCQNLTQRIKDNPEMLDLIFFIDEANYHLSGRINNENM